MTAASADFNAALGQLPPEQRQAVIQIMQASELSHSGPLPPPQQLRDYEQALPGLAERIVRLAESEQEHRHSVINLVAKREARLKERGQALGMAALILTLIFCAYLAAAGSPGAASAVAASLIVGVVSIFVTGRRADLKALQRDATSEDD